MSSSKKELLGTKPKLQEKKKFSLQEFKKKNNFDNTSFKNQEWIKISDGFKESTGLPGIPTGHITLLMGHSDSGKTSAMILAAANAQKQGMLPVLIITEMKWNWEHARQMGFEYEVVVDEETGEERIEGNFIYIDRSTLNSIEDVAETINSLIDEQTKGNLDYDLVFCWDSIGSISCRMSIEKNKTNNEWDAGAMSQSFGKTVNQNIIASRKSDSKYTNTLICINKVWVAKPDSPVGQPKIKTKGGDTMYFDSTLVIQFGNVTNSGATNIEATKDGKSVRFASRVNLQIKKNHASGVSTKGKIVVTPHTIIIDDKKEIDNYKKEHIAEIAEQLGKYDNYSYEDFKTVEIDESYDVGSIEPEKEKE